MRSGIGLRDDLDSMVVYEARVLSQNFQGVIGRTIVNHQQPPVLKCLVAHTFDGLDHVPAMIIGWHHHSDNRIRQGNSGVKTHDEITISFDQSER